MRILVFSWKDIEHPWAGGSEVNIHEQARRWSEAGHRVVMFTARPKGATRRAEIDGMRIYRAGNRFSVYLLAPLFYLFVLRHQADVVLDIINGIPFFTPLYCRKPVVALVHHVHQAMFLIELGPVVGRFGRLVERFLVPMVYRRSPVICVSESTASAVRHELFRGDALDLRIIHNGIDLSRYVTAAEEGEFPVPTVLYIGRLKKYKRLPLLISMMPAVREKVPEAELLVVGDGDATPEAMEASHRMGCDPFVHFRGFVDESLKVELYQRAWVLATPSSVEGWGLTVVEANACGTPALAFRVPGLSESIVDGETGLLAEDTDGFTRNLIEVLSDADLRARLAAKAFAWSRRFDWDVTAGRTLEVFTEVLERRR